MTQKNFMSAEQKENQFLEGLNARKARYLSEPYVFILNL